MDGKCHSELAFQLLTDSRAQRAPASTQLAFSGRWTERWLRRQVQSHPGQWSQTFLWGLLFLFATTSNLLLSSYSNKTISCSNKKWGNTDGHLDDIWQLNGTVRIWVCCANKHKGKRFSCILVMCEGFTLNASEDFTGSQRISLRFLFICSWNQGQVLLRPRLLNICVPGLVFVWKLLLLSGGKSGWWGEKRHSLQLSLWAAISPRLLHCK